MLCFDHTSFPCFVQFIERPHTLVDEDSQSRRCSPTERVEKMFEKVKTSLPGPPEFLLCVLPERKNCDIYGKIFNVSVLPCILYTTKLIMP